MQKTPTVDSQLSSPDRLRLAFLVILTVVTVIIFIMSGILAAQWRSTAFLGATLTHHMAVNGGTPGIQQSWAGLAAGLEPGDQIRQINDTPLKILGEIRLPYAENYQDIMGDLNEGDSVTVTFNRQIEADEVIPDYCQSLGANLLQCQLSYTLAPLPGGDFVAMFGIPFISGLVILLVSIFVLIRQGSTPGAFVPLIASLLIAIYMATLFDNGTTHELKPMWLASGALIGGFLITLGMIFPQPAAFARRVPLLHYVPVFLSILLAFYVLATYQREPVDSPGETAQTTGTAIIMGMAILATLLFFYQRPFASNQNVRDQANILFIGVVLALFPAGLWIASRIIQLAIDDVVFPLTIEATMPFFVTPIISLAYILLQYHRPFDSDRVISQAITYTILLASLIGGYFLLVVGATFFATDTVNTDDPLVIVLIIFSISLLFVPLRTRIQGQIDRIYFRTRRDYQNKLESFGQKLTSLAGPDVMIHEFRTMLGETLQPINTLIFLRDNQTENYIAYGKGQPETDVIFTPDSGVVKLLNKSDALIYLPPGEPWPIELYLDRARLGIIKVIVIAGMVGSEHLNGFVAVGPPRSGVNIYNYEELRFLNTLVGQLAIAVERAQVIDTLERSVRELEVLSQVGQAVNFTIEFDDLLELISSQTLRLIDAPYFYITLLDTKTNQIYYAFFLENDERIRSKENIKWNVGRDLYSEVIRSGQVKMIADYTRTMQQSHYDITFEADDIKAWMGVPLIAGSNTLGVVAVGASDPNTRFTNEQLKVFSNIGALAATSIDKANLFNETNARARQLEVLNDISRQLVASEGDIDKLLDLITSSAVEILNAEAGSLLLTTSDETKELEFRAAVGGTGHTLIGTRLPPGHGLVGKVAMSGEPAIANDISTDQRWDGEVVEEGFHTNSILAVPLVAKGNVIGVLEVINKKDGSVYITEDVDLLTTFAGQAAIALENARLLQLTDQQLAQRVRELEAIEIIDRELNQNLDLNKVGEITVRWGIQNSNAIAGVIGIVNDEKTHLEIIARHGYDADDVPEGAEGQMWPLDRGIVKRVMRTRGPDLQPDISIDPDYVPSLRNGLSQITVPMLSGDEINAILILETDQEPRLNLLDLAWVQRLSEHASIAIANAQLYSELTRANESKSEFVGFAAHELKNPLSSVKGYADLLKSGVPGELSDQQRDFLSIIGSNANRMQIIIDDLRDIARIDAQQLEVSLSPVNIRNVIVETLRPFQQALKDKEQELNNNVSEDLPAVMGDQMRLIQVFTNLVSNANKYSPKGATITINAEVSETIRNEHGSRIGPAIVVSVRDDGIGMEEEDLQKLFRVRYFRVKSEATQDIPGTGLGMMITHNIIQQHEGHIWAESELNIGTTFYVAIPLAPVETISQPKEPETEAASD